MDRFEASLDTTAAEMLDALARGDEVVVVRDGKIVAVAERMAEAADWWDREALRRAHEAAASLGVANAARSIRDMRDEGR